ncbi:hypothetical protein [Melittangium boletus]|nr:hypothetical protein [Melittangium boletus]
MKVKEFLDRFNEESQRIVSDIFEYSKFILHKDRKYKTIREEHIPLRAYLVRKDISPDAEIELGGEAHDFDAMVTYGVAGAEQKEIIEVVQAVPAGEHIVRQALIQGEMSVEMRIEESKQLNAFPWPIIDAIKKKHNKMYADKRVLLVSVTGEHTLEDDEIIESWIPDIQAATMLGNFSEIYLVETARYIIFKIH